MTLATKLLITAIPLTAALLLYFNLERIERFLLGLRWWRIRDRILTRLHYLPRSNVRRCRACERLTVFVCLGPGDEFKACVRCRATRRYEMLATVLKERLRRAAPRNVLELDSGSPVSGLLRKANEYTPTFWRPDIGTGEVRASDGARCEDVTRLTFQDASMDLIVSSDVLEHVVDARAAFRETARVLRQGGSHLFTVPMREKTRSREGLPPEYHNDPLDRRGIRAYWDYGPDLGDYFATAGLEFTAVAGPEGPDARIVWEARKV